MKNKYIKYKYNKNRAILTDVLPYETPIIFTNINYYEFLSRIKIQLKKSIVIIDEDTSSQDYSIKKMNKLEQTIIELLLGESFVDSQNREKKIIMSTPKIPFNFEVTHKISDFRYLSVIHPRDQLNIVEFYDKYKSLIIHFCNQSSYSIRKPVRVANSIYYKDYLHTLREKDKSSIIEIDSSESENLKSFFTVKNYSNINKFYESYQYHRCEKKYNHLLKFDIAQCFDSIYTHTISWAIFNKAIVKEKLNKKNKTFGDEFDELMMNLNYGETNGIVIGPEFSRIYAEIILQQVERKVYLRLEEKDIVYKKDYEIFRYVDDYFVFYDDTSVEDAILYHFIRELKLFKMRINESKTNHYKKPLITEITVAKQYISDFLNSLITSNKIDINTNEIEKKKISINSGKLITKYKIIVHDSKVKYKDIINYSLSGFERQVSKLLKNNEQYEIESFCRSLINIIDFIFFIYSTAPQVNSTIKVCMLISKIIQFIRNPKSELNYEQKHYIKKKISDEISDILRKNKNLNSYSIETLYLLIYMRELGRDYLLTENALMNYLNIYRKIDGEQINDFNYFTIIVLLFYIKNNKRYKNLKEILKKIISIKMSKGKKWNLKSTENTLLFFDIIVCPYIDRAFKYDIFKLNEINDKDLCDEIMNYQKLWFTKWDNFNALEQIFKKKSKEVY
jgi:hypothetical protein